jgi:hypothetical protein
MTAPHLPSITDLLQPHLSECCRQNDGFIADAMIGSLVTYTEEQCLSDAPALY